MSRKICTLAVAFIVCLSTLLLPAEAQRIRRPVTDVQPVDPQGPQGPQLLQPDFQTWQDQPQTYKKPDYPIVFIATYRDVDKNGNQIADENGNPLIRNGGNLGTDVLEVGSPSRGQELWLLMPDGSTERLFPIIGVHDSLGLNNQYLSRYHLSLWERSASQGRVRALVALTASLRISGKAPHPRLRPRPLPQAGEVTDCLTYDTYCLAVP